MGRPIGRLGAPPELGSTALVTLLCVVIALGCFMACANFVLDQYARGVVRTAVDEGARAGALAAAPAGPAAACRTKEREVMSGLLAGSFASGLRFGCAVEGSQVVATARGRLPSWLPPVPHVAVEATGVSELQAPRQP